MSNPESPASPEAKIHARIEAAETAAELIAIVDEIISTEEYMMRGTGGDIVDAANRAGIKKFGRILYSTTFDAILGEGMAHNYIALDDPKSDDSSG